jgi:predicted ATPase
MADGITRIAVEGFKSISKRQSIDIAPLTILAGANSSGKSSIMQPLLLLKQTLEATFDPGPLLILGGNVKFTSSDQFLSKSPKSVKQWSIAIETHKTEFSIVFSKGLNATAEILEASTVRRGVSVTLRPKMSPDQIRQVLGDLPFVDSPDLMFSVVPNRFFLDVKNEQGIVVRVMEGIEPFIQGLIHVPGLRGNPSRTYPVAGIGPNFPATFEYYAASVIAHWQSERDDRAKGLNDDLRHIGLTQQIKARRLNDAEIELLVSRLSSAGLDDMVSIADVGFGVSQTLPVLVALRAAQAGQLVYLEEPEIHLHPRAQVRLADVLADAAKRGVRVLVETHSTLLLTAIQTLVANGSLKPELVRLHWFQRGPRTGVTEVTRASLDENGAFGDWPEDFDDVILKAESAYLDAVTERSGAR